MYSDPYLLVEHMLECIANIEEFTEGMSKENFVRDKKTIYAVISNITILGEAVSKMNEEFKDKHPETNWFRIKGMRNRLIHDYKGINLDLIFDTIQEDLPHLKIQLQAIRP